MKKIPTVDELFDTSHTIASRLVESSHYGYRAIMGLGDFIRSLIQTLGSDYEEIYEGVFASKDASISENASIVGPTVICSEAEIRTGAFIRGTAIIGRGAVIGNSSEVKNSIVFDEAKLPHYNYLGDSIIGYRAHMGAGVVASNVRLDKKAVKIRYGDEIIDTGMKKLGAMIGDYAEIGCNSVLSPGSILGRESLVYPLSHINGTIAEKQIYDGKREERFR